ncbi:hypothetical protein [Micromonospora rubida]
MNRSEIAALLGAMAARDRRTIGKSEVEAWHTDIGDLDFDVARDAVNQHFRSSDAYLMPVHVRRLAADITRERSRIAREERERLSIEAAQEGRAGRNPVRDRSDDVTDMLATLRDRLGPSDPTVLRRAEWVREERLRQRTAAAPNPHYQGPPPPGGWPLPAAETA